MDKDQHEYTPRWRINKTHLIQKPAVTSAHHEVVTVSRNIVTHGSIGFVRGFHVFSGFIGFMISLVS